MRNFEGGARIEADNPEKKGRVIERAVMGKTQGFEQFNEEQFLIDINDPNVNPFDSQVKQLKAIALDFKKQGIPLDEIEEVGKLCDIIRQPDYQPEEKKREKKDIRNATTFMADVREEVTAQLELFNHQMVFYTGVDSPIDNIGIDGFLDIYTPSATNSVRPLRITLDVTIDELKAKDGGGRSSSLDFEGERINNCDVVFHFPKDGIDGGGSGAELYEQLKAETVQKIITAAKEKAERLKYVFQPLNKDATAKLKQRDFIAAAERIDRLPKSGRIKK